MKVISCASYYGSGSSAITDLISEYKKVYSLTDMEFRFLHDPYGISDLEFNLVENFNRHNSGWALKKYKKMVDFYAGNFLTHRYEKIFNGNWKTFSYKYIDSLTDFRYHGSWMYDQLDKGMFFFYFVSIVNKIFRETIWRNHPEHYFNPLRGEITYCSHPTEEYFLKTTKKYIYDLLKSVSNGHELVMVDQIVPSSNLKRYIRYFNNIQVFLVDRDPRDVYCLEKYVWKDNLIPRDPVNFCKWFEYTRKGREKELRNKEVKFVQFEDLIYHYPETVNEIENWVGLSPEDHMKSKQVFNPNESINNTQVWKKIDCNLDEIQYIEKNLPDYLYKKY